MQPSTPLRKGGLDSTTLRCRGVGEVDLVTLLLALAARQGNCTKAQQGEV